MIGQRTSHLKDQLRRSISRRIYIRSFWPRPISGRGGARSKMLQEQEKHQWRGCHFLELACSPNSLTQQGEARKQARTAAPSHITFAGPLYPNLLTLCFRQRAPRPPALPISSLILSISLHLDAQIVRAGPLTRRDNATRMKMRKVYQCDFMNFCATLSIGTKVRHL